MMADETALLRLLLPLRKKLTVIGIIGHTQGVTSAMRPPRKPAKNMYQRLRPCWSGASSKTRISASTLAHHLSALTPDMLAPGVMKPSALCSESVISVMALTMLSFWASSAFFASSFISAERGEVPVKVWLPITRRQPLSLQACPPISSLTVHFSARGLIFWVNTTVPE